PHEAVVLGPFGVARASAHAGRVDEPVSLATELCDRVHGVPCGSRDVVHDRALVAYQTVEERRLPDVRSSRYRDRDLFALGLAAAAALHGCSDDVQQVARAPAVQRADGEWFAETEPLQTTDLALACSGVDLVRNDDDRDGD